MVQIACLEIERLPNANSDSMNASPVISVVMPVYNAARFLRDAVNSVLTQTFADFELIAVDDGSTDQSRDILESLAATDRRIRIISRANTGIVGALNDGLAVARGEFIARMDADDLSLPIRFERQLTWLRANPDHVGVGSYFNYIDQRSARVKWNPRLTEHDDIEASLMTGDGGTLIHPSIMVRREAIDQAGRYRIEAQWIEDLDLYLRLARIGRLANIPEVLVDYRFHKSSVNFTRNDGRHLRKLWVMQQACAARGIVYNSAVWPAPTEKSAFHADYARDFALSSLHFHGLRTPWRYALSALWQAPGDRQSWRVASYLLKVSLGLIARPVPLPALQRPRPLARLLS